MAYEAVQADVVARDKTQEALKRAGEGLKQYAAQAQASIASVADKFAGLGTASKLLSSLGGFGGIAGLAGGAGIAGITSAAAEKMLDTARAAKILGVSVGQMQVITVAAKKGPEELTGALSHLMMQLGQARQGSVQAAQALAGAGLSMKTMAGGTAQQALQEIVKGLNGINDPAQRASRSIAAFGREGYQSMATLIAGGLDAMDAAHKKIMDSGAGFTDESVEKIKGAKAALADLKMSVDSLGQSLAVTLAPAIKTMAEGLQKILDKVKQINDLDPTKELLDKLANSEGSQKRRKWLEKEWSWYFPETIVAKTERPEPKPPPWQAPMRARLPEEMASQWRTFAGIEPSKLEKFRDGMDRLNQAAQVGAVTQEQYQAKFKELHSALDISYGPMERYREKWQDIVDKWREGRMTAAGMDEALRDLNTNTFQVGRIEAYRQKWEALIVEWQRGQRTIQSLTEAQNELNSTSFGPLMSKNLGDKLKEKLTTINEDYRTGFGGRLKGKAAEREYRERANAAMRETGGFGKTDQEIAKDAAESAANARRVGRPDAAEKIEADAERDRVQRIRERADRRAGLLGPNADLMTDDERMKATISSLRLQRSLGGFGQGPEADELFNRSILKQVVKPVADRTPAFQSHFEGLQDTWKRIQASKASSSDDPQQKAVDMIEANLPALKEAGVDTAALLQSLLDLAQKNDRKPHQGIVGWP